MHRDRAKALTRAAADIRIRNRRRAQVDMRAGRAALHRLSRNFVQLAELFARNPQARRVVTEHETIQAKPALTLRVCLRPTAV